MPYGSAAIDTIESSGNLAITGNVTTTGTFALGTQALSTPFAGEFEYDGRVPYFTPLGTQRGVIPGMQYYRLESTVAGSNATGAQSIFGVGVTLSSSTQYAFECAYILSKSAGTTSHTIANGFGGTATVNNINYWLTASGGFTLNTVNVSYAMNIGVLTVTTLTAMTGAQTSASNNIVVNYRGTVSINAGGTFIPQYSLSAAPGGAYTTQIGGYFLIYPIGAAGANINVGTWA